MAKIKELGKIIEIPGRVTKNEEIYAAIAEKTGNESWKSEGSKRSVWVAFKKGKTIIIF